jgi:hypothetical protein
MRVLSRVSPSMPSAMNRACHRHTTGFDLPDRRMISAVPPPAPTEEELANFEFATDAKPQ